MLLTVRIAFLLCLTFFLTNRASAETIVVEDVNLISLRDGEELVAPHMTVVIRDGVIESVIPFEESDEIQEARVISGEGLYLLPGLIDMHVHVWGPADLKAYPSFGVTTVRNLSGMPFHLEYQKSIEAGEMVGPRLITSGPILNSPGPNAQVNHKIVNNAQEARAAVRHQYEQGFRLLKVYSNLNRESYEAILEEAALLGMEITGHPPEGERLPGIPEQEPFLIGFDEILDDGFQTLEHVESIVWHALYDSLEIDAARDLAKAIAKAEVPVDPTLVAHHNLLETASHKEEYLQRPGTEILNPFIKLHEHPVFEYWKSQPDGTRREFEEFYLKVVSIFQEEGVTLVAGSDAGIFCNIPGDSLHQELDLLVEAGLSPVDVLRIATVNGADTLGLGDSIGHIAPGFKADLILVTKDPTEDIGALRDLHAVILAGEFLDRDRLQQLKKEAGEASIEETQLRVFKGLEAQGTSLE